MKKYFIYLCIFWAAFILSCSESEKDDEVPVIDMSGADDFPQNCTEISRGQVFTFMATFTDNAELGSYSLEIHNNFDHHTHSTDMTECEMDPQKSPVNPFLFIGEFEIPEGLKTYEATAAIEVPEDCDPGDYHFMIRVTDAEGWQTIKGISIKII